MTIDYAIMTVARPVDYIRAVLDGLHPTLPLRLVVGSPDVAYLSRIVAARQLQVIVPDELEWNSIKTKPVGQRAAWNYWRCFVLGPQSKERQGLVIFEDDVALTYGWEERLHKVVATLNRRHGERYILALYSANVISKAGNLNCVERFPVDRFFGTQAMYFPERIREVLQPYLKRFGVDAFRAPYDWLVRDFAKAKGIPIFRCVPSLAQHIGLVTTGLGKFHKSNSFVPELAKPLHASRP
jgi:hypothetical protein